MYYTGAEEFLKAKLRKGEKTGKVYVHWDRKRHELKFDVSSITPRLSGAVEAILREYQESVFPPSIAKSLKGYQLQLKKGKKTSQLIAFIPKEMFSKGKVPPVVRVEYLLNSDNRVTETHAYLHIREKIDAVWSLKKYKYKKYMIQTNVITLKLNKGILTQKISYDYTEKKGLILPKKITIKSRFDRGKYKSEYIKFSDFKVK